MIAVVIVSLHFIAVTNEQRLYMCLIVVLLEVSHLSCSCTCAHLRSHYSNCGAFTLSGFSVHQGLLWYIWWHIYFLRVTLLVTVLTYFYLWHFYTPSCNVPVIELIERVELVALFSVYGSGTRDQTHYIMLARTVLYCYQSSHRPA